MTVGRRRLGDLVVAAQGLGCMGMSSAYGPADEHESIATMRRALDLGVTLLDTADIYGGGQNERLVGRAVRGRREEVVIVSKVGFVTPSKPSGRRLDSRPERIPVACDASLARLGVEAIDLYVLHRVDPLVPIEDAVGAMASLVTKGKVRAIGLSEPTAVEIRKAHAIHPLGAVQSEWSLSSREVETNGVLDVVRELGIGLTASAPLARGLLTGSLTSLEALDEDDVRRDHPRFQIDNFAQNLHLAGKLHAFASERGWSGAQLALAWLLSMGQDVVPIPGTRRLGHLEENAAADEIRLTHEEIEALDAMVPSGAVAGRQRPLPRRGGHGDLARWPAPDARAARPGAVVSPQSPPASSGRDRAVTPIDDELSGGDVSSLVGYEEEDRVGDVPRGPCRPVGT